MHLRQKIILIIFGLFFTFILLEISLRLGGFILLSLQEQQNRISIHRKNFYRIMCLGESTTARGKDPYPSQLEDILNAHNVGIRFSVINKGIIGTNTSVILSQLEYNLDRYKPDMIITMMGINDGKIYMPYEDNAHPKAILFIRSLRTYKLARLIWMHLVAKAKETGLYKLRRDGKNDKGQAISSGASLHKVYDEPESLAQKEEILKQAIALNPRNDEAYCELGDFYRENGNYIQAEETFKKAIEFSFHNDAAYCELGELYRDNGNYIQAEEIIKKSIALNPRNDEAYRELGYLYRDLEKYDQAKEMFERAIALNPSNDEAYCELAGLYRNEANYILAKEFYEKTIKLNPKNDEASLELAWIYRSERNYDQAEEVLKRIVRLSHKDESIHWALGILYHEMGKHNSAEECLKNVAESKAGYYNPRTRFNYEKLISILTKRKINLVCVQYPMRSVESLRKMLPMQEGITFVDNEMVFKEALKKASYKDYFTDMFAVDFGHCTPRGNRLLAENIANVLLKEVFKKR